MSRCKNCHAEISNEYPLKVTEYRAYDGLGIWVHEFCNWSCLAKYMIKARMVRVTAN